MPQKGQQTEMQLQVCGVVLLFLGIVFLLQTFNVIPWALWGALWRFWPILIVILGMRILFSNWNHWLLNVLFLALLFACLGMAIWQYGLSSDIGPIL